MGDPVSAFALVVIAVTGIVSAVSSHKAQEDAREAEREYQEQQDRILITEARTKIKVLQEELVSVGGQATYEYGQIGKKGYATYGAQRALYGFGGAELDAGGSPLMIESATLEETQADLSYRQGWYAAELARREAEITGLEEQVDIILKSHPFWDPETLNPDPSKFGIAPFGGGTRLSPGSPGRSLLTQGMFRGGFAGMR